MFSTSHHRLKTVSTGQPLGVEKADAMHISRTVGGAVEPWIVGVQFTDLSYGHIFLMTSSNTVFLLSLCVSLKTVQSTYLSRTLSHTLNWYWELMFCIRKWWAVITAHSLAYWVLSSLLHCLPSKNVAFPLQMRTNSAGWQLKVGCPSPSTPYSILSLSALRPANCSLPNRYFRLPLFTFPHFSLIPLKSEISLYITNSYVYFLCRLFKFLKLLVLFS